MSLNELTPSLAALLPPTDSRFRRDVRALEVGALDEVRVSVCVCVLCRVVRVGVVSCVCACARWRLAR